MIKVDKKSGLHMEGSFLELADEFANVCAGMKHMGVSLESAKKIVEQAYFFEENGEKPMDDIFLKKDMLKSLLKKLEQEND